MKHTAGIRAFGLHLRRLRQARKLTQYALADYADISRPTVQRIEKGETAASLDVLLALAHALDIPLRELVDAPGIDKLA
ncbi:helix-turn-helix domain-containing protein [Hymenobacter lucidus]|uniref:Helix-turn-helix domain-containing protein n=1 Tax=Hymenobacter lucidus TaxID=2880930 RepID=A0ABS8AQM0_9BACT|nr:helix-turn-helix transcriptional regulator [Hymenobacter lucidus]MCB2407016.1 helix-turn-helix domain-containing protein [Hymenobacter lucidus]